MEVIPKSITFTIKMKKGGKMAVRKLKVLKAGSKVVPCMSKTGKKAAVKSRKSYPYN